jgi:outer membrane protein assembly factor BamB/tRNA A-37 threonylcarbamoyl transferase component Bud32
MSASEERKGLLERLKAAQGPDSDAASSAEEPLGVSEDGGIAAGEPPSAPDVSAIDTTPEDALPHRTEEDFLSPGERLQNRYEIRKFLSKGGMGAVYLARDIRFPSVEKLVAVKEMISTIRDSVTSRISLETFEREANILASLSHPAIPKVFDYFHQERRVYLVIEFIEGTDLESLLAEIDYPLPQEKVVDWAVQACDVLTYLHNHKPSPIVFRDMKPSNIMLRQDGHIVLIDFGIAKVFQAGKRGTMIGTEGYSPPEQYRGIAEPRGDLYALGATLHHLLTKRDPRKEPPFTFQDHPIRGFNPTVTPELEAVIGRTLNYEIEDRYASAEELKKDLLRVLSPTSGILSTILSEPLTLHDERNPLWAFSCEDEIRSTPAISENALYLGCYDKSLYCLEADTGSERWRYSTEGGVVSSPCVWNETVFFGSEDRILYAVFTRTGRIVWTCPTNGKIRSSPKQEYGYIFFGSDDHNVYAVSAKSGQERWRFDAGAPVRSSPAISGEFIVFGSDDGCVHALDAQSGESRWKYQTGRALQSSPTIDGDMVYAGSRDSSLYALDIANGWPVWRYRTKGQVISSPVVVGNVVYFGSNDHHVYAVNADKGNLIWKYSTKGAVISSPVSSDGNIYVGSADGNLHCLDAKTGELLWRFVTGGPITGSAVVANGVVYVGSTDHTMYAVSIQAGD